MIHSASSLRHHPLGARVPDSTHAVVVSLPTMADVIGYEEGSPDTAASMKTGYPRFKRHPYVERVAHRFAVACGAEGRALYPVCSHRAARDTVAFAGATDARIDAAPEGWCLVSISPVESAAAERAKKYLQHTGVQLSSRQAEDILVAAGELAAAGPETPVADGDEARVIAALAPYLKPAGAGDIVVCRSGMSAFHAAFLAARDLQRARGRTVWLQLGWLYVDTPEILRKFLGADERHVMLGDVGDLHAIEKCFAEYGDRIAGVVTEFPTNPLIRTGDIERLSELCLRYGAVRLFDPSSAGIVNVEVMPWSDLVVASLTKYSGNAGDVMLGAVAVNPAGPFADRLRDGIAAHREPAYARDIARLAAQIGGMEAVADAINANTMKLVAALERHPAVRRVHWAYSPGSAEHYARIARGPARPGSLFTIELKHAPGRFLDRLRCVKGPSFGTTFTIVCPFAYLAHYDLVSTPAGRRELIARGLDPELMRIAVGTEPFDALLAVFEEALA